MAGKRVLPPLLNGGVAIVGLGLMGGSIARALKEYSRDIKIAALDQVEEPLERALADGTVDEAAVLGTEPEKTRRILSECRFIVLALYPAGMIRFLLENRECFSEGTVVMDICGLKGDFVTEAQNVLPSTVEFIGAHPMAGREKSGYAYASGELFLGATFIVTPTEKNRPETVRATYELAKILGFARVREVDPEEHDRLIAYTSHMPHVLASVLMRAWNGGDEVKSFAGGGFRDATRVADINEDLWTELFMMNSQALTESLHAFLVAYGEFLSLMEASDAEGLKAFLRESAERKRSWNEEQARFELNIGKDAPGKDTADGNQNR